MPLADGFDRLTEIRRVVIHHSAGPRSETYEAIVRGHTAPKPAGNGWLAIGYHGVVLGDGSWRPGRRLPLAGAHAPPANFESIGICVVGNNVVPEQRWTAAQVATLRRYLEAIRLVVPGVIVCGHRDVGHPTLCPGLTRAALLALLGL